MKSAALGGAVGCALLLMHPILPLAFFRNKMRGPAKPPVKEAKSVRGKSKPGSAKAKPEGAQDKSRY